MDKLKKISQELSVESFKMLIPYTLIMLVLGLLGAMYFELVVNNLFALIAYVANIDVIATNNLGALFTSIYLYPLYFILFMVIGIAILVQYLFLINIVNRIYISVKGEEPKVIFSKQVLIDILKILCKKIRVIPIMIFFIYFVLLLSLFGINIENMIVNRINITDVITSTIFSSGFYTVAYVLFKILLLLVIARLTPFIFVYAMKDYSVKETFIESNKVYKKHMIKIIVFLLVIFAITGISDIYSYFIGDDLFYTIYASTGGIKFREVTLFIISLPLLIMDEFVTILFLLYFIHVFYDDDENIDVENSRFSTMVKKPWYIFSTVVIVVSLVFAEYVSFQVFFDDTKDQTEIMVHRGGGNEVFENTKESIYYSVEKGYPAIEIDTMELADGEIILVHDKTLSRIANINIRVKDLTLEEIKSIKMIGGYDFITLNEALDLVKEEDIVVNIELKYHGDESADYVSNIVSLVTEKSMEAKVYISSFDYDDLLLVETLNSDIKTMYFSFFFLGNLSNLRVDSVGVDVTYLSSDQFYTFNRYGYEVALFTVNKKKDMLSSLSYELEYIISDEPESLDKLIDGIAGVFDTN